MATKSKIATEKVWRTHKGQLVKDGDENAAVLVARRGQVVSDEELRRYSNADSFFVEEDSREGEAAQREVKEDRKPWTQAEIQAYRNAREDDEPTRSTLERIEEPKEHRIAPAEAARSRQNLGQGQEIRR